MVQQATRIDWKAGTLYTVRENATVPTGLPIKVSVVHLQLKVGDKVLYKGCRMYRTTGHTRGVLWDGTPPQLYQLFEFDGVQFWLTRYSAEQLLQE